VDLTCATSGTAASSYDSTSRDVGSNRVGNMRQPRVGWYRLQSRRPYAAVVMATDSSWLSELSIKRDSSERGAVSLFG
jgi:hypothetical protein